MNAVSETNQTACEQGAEILVAICGQFKNEEKALVVVDPETKDVGEHVVAAAQKISPHVRLMISEPLTMHGQEPSEEIAQVMMESDLIFGLTKFSMLHTRARLNAVDARYLSLPDYDLNVLSRPALQADFEYAKEECLLVKQVLDAGSKVRIVTALGTNLSLQIEGREANSCPGMVYELGMVGSPPDIETNIAPLETLTEGIIVIDGSIPCPEVGKLNAPVQLTVEQGKIVDFGNSKNGEVLLRKFSKEEDAARVLAELGFGLNPMATISGYMLEDEGCYGTVHFGFGSNSTIGGVNHVGFHLDFVMTEPTVLVDDTLVLEKGRNLLKDK